MTTSVIAIANNDWVSTTVGECLDPSRNATSASVPTRAYRPTGRFPIIDQSAKAIAGYTDDESLVIKDGLPLVVFGDHTRALKYVDFPFARGADGTQILRTKSNVDAKFFYYACRNIDLPSRGYNRHFTLFREQGIRLPGTLEEQRMIVRVLERVDEAITTEDRAATLAEELMLAVRGHLFAQGLQGDEHEATGISAAPWDYVRLDAVADVISTRMPYSTLESMTHSTDAAAVRVLGIKVSDMNRPGNEVELTHAAVEVDLDLDVATKACAPPGTIIFPKRGAAIATNKKRFAYTWTVFDPNVIGVRARPGLDQRFLFHWFQAFDLRSITEPGPTPQLNKKNLEPLLVPTPPTIEEQQQIAAILDQLNTKAEVHRAKRAVLDELLETLLRGLMSGDIRLGDLDLSALPTSTESLKESV
ncbi:restriction endonuclease subunit S [Micromonospora purpureochromogenes]|uniref:restriction endonuclease subunit S n=1 Tax=Micromonospora purpureochromogenes TaxID=47872 RepID=UPI0033F52A18